MSDSLDSLAIMTVQSEAGVGYEYLYLWYFEDEGLKRSKDPNYWVPDGITDLSTKEKLRWSKVCEWLDDYFRRNPTRRNPTRRKPHLSQPEDGLLLSQPENGNLLTFSCKLEPDMGSTLVANISNFPGGLIKIPRLAVTKKDIHENREFFLILVVLSLVYGGIHLATWNFAFPSKTEHLLWKIACIDIMATVPIGVLCLLGLDSVMPLMYPWTFHGRYVFSTDSYIPFWAIFYVLSVPYALSRIYLVVESLIGLRHVPIGVYAAVPWVQAIPHV